MYKAYRVTDVPAIDSRAYPDARRDSDARTRNFLRYLQELARQEHPIIDGDRISEIFFPDGAYDLFVSHSHKDRGAALELKNICASRGYKAFVDSDTWLDVNDLIKNLLVAGGAGAYKNVLHLASNAYIMLATALMQIIAQAKVFVFLQTPHSLPHSVGPRYQTHSPWLKLELETCHLLSQQLLEEHAITAGLASVDFSYTAEVSGLRLKPYSWLTSRIADHKLLVP